MQEGILQIIKRAADEGHPIHSALTLSDDGSKPESLRTNTMRVSVCSVSEGIYNSITPLISDPENLPFKDDTVDAIINLRYDTRISSDDRTRILKEFARVSRKWVVMDYPCLKKIRPFTQKTDPGKSAMQPLSRREIRDELKRGGFRLRFMNTLNGQFSGNQLVLGEHRHKGHYTAIKGNVSQKRWMSYWYQIYEVLNLRPRRVLEVGIGSRWVTDCLRSRGVSVRTIDISSAAKPDYIGSVTSLPFKDGAFDVVLCAEVLEHLPFEQFRNATRELRRVTASHVVLTLPNSAPVLSIDISTPILKIKRFFIKLPLSFKKNMCTEHLWEIGKRGLRLREIIRILSNIFIVEKEYVPFENDKHHFFVLKKK